MAGEVGGEDGGIIVAEGDAERKVVGGRDAVDFAAVGVPESKVVVTTAGDEASVVCIVDPERAGVVGVPAFELFAFLHFPKFDGAIFTGGGEEFGIAAPA